MTSNIQTVLKLVARHISLKEVINEDLLHIINITGVCDSSISRIIKEVKTLLSYHNNVNQFKLITDTIFTTTELTCSTFINYLPKL